MAALMWMLWAGIGVAIVVLIWVLMSFKHEIIISDVTGSTPLVTFDKFREKRDKKTGAITWMLLKSRMDVQPAKSECIRIKSGLGGPKKLVEAIRASEGGLVFVKISSKITDEIEKWKPEFQPVCAESRAFLHEQIQKANSRVTGDWLKQNALPLVSLAVVGIVAVCGLMFWEDVWKPIGGMQEQAKQIGEINYKTSTQLYNVLQELNYLKYGKPAIQDLSGPPAEDLIPPDQGAVPQ